MGKGISEEGKGKNLGFEIKTKASVTDRCHSPGTQLHEVRGNTRLPQIAVWALVWALIPSQGREDPKIPFNPSSEVAPPLPGWAAGGEQRLELQLPKLRPSPHPAQPQPCSCCQQPLPVAPGPSQGPSLGLSLGWLQGSCHGSQESVSLAALGVGSVLQPSFLGVFLGAAGATADPLGCCSLILTSSLQEPQGRQPPFPGSSL